MCVGNDGWMGSEERVWVGLGWRLVDVRRRREVLYSRAVNGCNH